MYKCIQIYPIAYLIHNSLHFLKLSAKNIGSFNTLGSYNGDSKYGKCPDCPRLQERILLAKIVTQLCVDLKSYFVNSFTVATEMTHT